jgi:hypothetical protein
LPKIVDQRKNRRRRRIYDSAPLDVNARRKENAKGQQQ